MAAYSPDYNILHFHGAADPPVAAPPAGRLLSARLFLGRSEHAILN
jgi:hypothetical protein